MDLSSFITSARHRHMKAFVDQMQMPKTVTNQQAQKTYRYIVLVYLLRRDGVQNLPSTNKEEAQFSGRVLSSVRHIDTLYQRWLRAYQKEQEKQSEGRLGRVGGASALIDEGQDTGRKGRGWGKKK